MSYNTAGVFSAILAVRMLMYFLDILKIVGFLFGTVIHIAILRLICQRIGRKRHEVFFILLVCAALLWYLGSFLSQFIGHLFTIELRVLINISHIIAITGGLFIYPFLLHTLLYFSQENGFKISSLYKGVLLIYSYLPVVGLPWTIEKLLSYPSLEFVEVLGQQVSYFIGWGNTILLLSFFFTLSLKSRAEDEEEARFYYIISWLFIGISCLMTLTFILGGARFPFIGPYLTLFSQLAFILPTITFAYYIYRYNYMEFAFKRGLLYSILGILVITLYLFVLKPLGNKLEKRFFIYFEMIEGILVLLLVFFFEPLKRKLQELTNRLFFKEEKYYRKVFRDLSMTINSGTYMDLAILLEYVAYTVSKAMHFSEVSIVLLNRDSEGYKIYVSTLPWHNINISGIIDYVESYQLKILNIYEIDRKDIIRDMKDIGASTILSIYHEDRLFGFLNLGKRRFKRHLLAEEEEMLTILANQMVVAIENTRLVREKLEMERRMYENEKLSSLGRLSASIAHEVKNPLSSIKIITQVMIEELASNDPNQEGLSIIISEIDRLTRVVNQLLRFARPDTKELGEFEMSEVINDIIMLLRHEAKKNKVEILNKVDNSIRIFSDKDALTEIFFNMIHNSIQAMPEGGEVRILSEIVNQNVKKEINIMVQDNGPGIPKPERDKIFEPFFTTKQTGTGLGLTIVKQRLSRLHGSISIDDGANQGIGVTFRIRLPFLDEGSRTWHAILKQQSS